MYNQIYLDQISPLVEQNKKVKIVGGAGSGKTTLLGEIISKYENRNILAITFTNVAVDELNNRFGNKIIASTIHGFLWQFVSQFKSELILSAEDYFKIESINEIEYSILGIHSYDEESKKISLSHNELLELSAHFFTNNPNLSIILCSLYDMILIDEYQDTSLEVLQIFLSECINIPIILFGDYLQRLYSETDNTSDFDLEVIIKNDNFRSSEKLVNFYNAYRNIDNPAEAITQIARNPLVSAYNSKLLYIKVSNNQQRREVFQKLDDIMPNSILHLTHKLRLGANDIIIPGEYSRYFKNNSRIFTLDTTQMYEHLKIIYYYIRMKRLDDAIIKELFKIKYNNEITLEHLDIFNNYVMQVGQHSTIQELLDDANFREVLTLSTKVIEELESISGVNISLFTNLYNILEEDKNITIHSTKGAELNNVVVNVDNGKWNVYKFDNFENIKTRIMFYTAITRAKQNLVLVVNVDHPNLESLCSNHFVVFSYEDFMSTEILINS